MLFPRLATLFALGLLSLLAAASGQASIPIEHFIFIIQENHSFDNYFGTFPNANGIPSGTVLADYPGYGFGFRVPAIVISPYSRSGVVVHTTYDLTSPLKLVETKFQLPALTGRDNASNTMLECFDFSQAPLPADIITENTKLDFSKMTSR